MSHKIQELIRARKSVRTFDGTPVDDDAVTALEAHLEETTNPFGVPVDFSILDGKSLGLSSPVITGADTWLAAKVGRVEHFEVALGYSFEDACLFALSLGLGTVMLAASLKRKAFEAALHLAPDEVMPVASPLGHAASKRSMRDSLMRKGMGSDARKPFEELFFDGSFDHPLSRANGGIFADALEMARWAPSATNQQPWRVVVTGDTAHFFERQSIRESGIGDVQKVDVGIALCHFDLTLRESGTTGSFSFTDPGIKAPKDTRYITTYRMGS